LRQKGCEESSAWADFDHGVFVRKVSCVVDPLEDAAIGKPVLT
jgi:hypothetical protein